LSGGWPCRRRLRLISTRICARYVLAQGPVDRHVFAHGGDPSRAII
jgi:hypothetical protein